MAIDIHRYRNVAMAKNLLDDLGMDAKAQEECGGAVAKVVKPDIAQISFL